MLKDFVFDTTPVMTVMREHEFISVAETLSGMGVYFFGRKPVGTGVDS